MCKYCDAQTGESNHLGDGYIAIGKNPKGLLLYVDLFSDEQSANIKFDCFESGFNNPVASVTIPIKYCPGCGREL